MTAPTPTAPVSQLAHSNHFDWQSCDAYLFDIDGTILRSRDRVHYNAMNRAMLDVYGKNTTIARVAYHGMTDLGIMRAALADGLEVVGHARRTVDDADVLGAAVLARSLVDDVTDLGEPRRLEPITDDRLERRCQDER